MLLDVDREYRRRARLGQQPRIAPLRFNPAGEAWLPLMRVVREGWKLDVLFSNTERANWLGRTHDWVMIRYRRGRYAGQCTIVSARTGRLRELRVVKGREPECRRHYAEREIA